MKVTLKLSKSDFSAKKFVLRSMENELVSSPLSFDAYFKPGKKSTGILGLV